MGIPSRGRGGVVQHSAEHYRRYWEQLVKKGTVQREHAENTQVNIWVVMKEMDTVGDW